MRSLEFDACACRAVGQMKRYSARMIASGTSSAMSASTRWNAMVKGVVDDRLTDAIAGHVPVLRALHDYVGFCSRIFMHGGLHRLKIAGKSRMPVGKSKPCANAPQS
ncbi:hypothetical protein [Rhodopila sp.]|uniref:hypothetical protein n=1 Tax=Rhodopila sp. TaxID=2480087 RepID=UPI003D102DC6